MPRLPRLQYENAIHHIVARGDGRRRLFHDEPHYERFTDGLVGQVDRCGWQVRDDTRRFPWRTKATTRASDGTSISIPANRVCY